MASIQYKNGSNWVNALSLAYPVGSVYISYTNNSPANWVGGTWSVLNGVFPYFNSGTGTGGSNEHALTVEEMPSHRHDVTWKATDAWKLATYSATGTYNASTYNTSGMYFTSASTLTWASTSAGGRAILQNEWFTTTSRGDGGGTIICLPIKLFGLGDEQLNLKKVA